jgi:nitrate/nitrite transport system substrate-binding protein
MSVRNRRQFLTEVLGPGMAALVLPALSSGCGSSPSRAGEATAAGSPAGAGGKIRIGIIPLTDCASVVMAHELGLYEKHGVDVEVSKEASWANVRDKLMTGELQAAHCLFGMPFSVHTGVGGTAGKELKIAMVLNNNGQAITLAKALSPAIGFRDIKPVKAALKALAAKKTPTFAMTFPGGTHDMWLRYWLAAAGIDAATTSRDVKIITIPPPQMVANMSVGNMDGFCVGEPWNGVAVKQGIGFTHLTTQDLWKHHPEKALVANPDFAERRRDDLKKVMAAVLEASRWLEETANLPQAAATIGGQAYVNAPADVIDARLKGEYELGVPPGHHTYKEDMMRFHRGGEVNYPRKSHGVWYLAQYVRFGYLKELPDARAIADRLILQDLYAEVASEMSIPVPRDDMQPFTVDLDGITFDPKDPSAALAQHGAKA